MNRKGRFSAIFLIILMAIFFAEGVSKTTIPPIQKSIFQSTGTIVSVDSENGFITIKDTDFPLWLKNLPMLFQVDNKNTLNTFAPGNKIKFSVVRNDKYFFVNYLIKME